VSKTSSSAPEMTVTEALPLSPEPETKGPSGVDWLTPVKVMTPTDAPSGAPLRFPTTLNVPAAGAISCQISMRPLLSEVDWAPTRVRLTPLYVSVVTDGTPPVSFVMETPTRIRRFEPEDVCEIVKLEPVVVPVDTASTCGELPGVGVWVGVLVGVGVGGTGVLVGVGVGVGGTGVLVGVGVGGTGVLVGVGVLVGSGVLVGVGGTGVLVGVAVGGTGVLVGVAVGGTGVLVGVAVGGIGLLVGVAVGGTGVLVGSGVLVRVGVRVGVGVLVGVAD